MDDLIEALTILRKYGNPYAPTHCVHDELWVAIKPELVSSEDKARLSELGFDVPGANGWVDGFRSFRFGSC